MFYKLLTPTRRFWHEEDTASKKQRGQYLQCQWGPKLRSAGVDKIEANANPAGGAVSDQDKNTWEVSAREM
jgi:hypothetical protein